ncbi:MAG: tRNA (N(6)-L-threonylcarbamoyladenosine(37)-C(2))-methylthiotransferase MtaB [Saprospiraceae bacterium]|nr:tRNA (N(6)-L-threonylcarbamoyladenosine(37)-C(2))-methylthiotransferase MtaB [Saprospiraceae bacterium]
MATPVSVSFHTLGCKLNFAETSSIRQQFEAAGYHVHPFDNGADICVINTCSVTDFADRKCRKAVRQALHRNADSKIVVIGCYAQLKPHEIADIEGVDLVLGASEKFNLLNYVDRLDKAPGKGWVKADDIESVQTFTDAFSYGDRTRSFLKIQDGCDYNCSFCTIPQARGKSRSDSIEHVTSNARLIAERGIREIVLTGVNIGDFRDPLNESGRFADLVRALETNTDVPRYRISSIEPNLCSDEVIDLVAQSGKFMPHFHMPLQSGNDKQLKLMRRRYKRELYFDRVAHIRQSIPHACIGADVIVGFPGELEEDFNETKQFLADLDVNYLHVFTYSERANTPAIILPGSVSMEIRRDRNEQLRRLSLRKQRQFYQKFLGSSRPVLIEKSKKSGFLNGFTDNYIKVQLREEKGLSVNEIFNLHLHRISEKGIVEAQLKSEIQA